MYVGGEIRELAAIGQPSIGIVTAVQPVHLSRIGSIEAIEDAKAELVEALPAAADGGVAILNADDERVRRMASRTRARVTTYGFATDADVRAVDVVSRGLDGMRFRLVTAAGERVGRDLGARAARGPQRAGGDGRRSRRGPRARRDRARACRAVARAAPLDGDPRRRRRDRRRRVQRLARVDGRGARAAGRACRRRGGSRSWARCASWARRTTRATGRSARRPPRRSTCSWSSMAPGGAAAGIADGALAAGMAPDRVITAADAAPPWTSCSPCVAAGRRRAGQGLARRRARARRRWPSPRRWAARTRRERGDDPRADPGPAARVRPRRDPDAAVHAPAAPLRLREADPRARARRATWSRRGRRRWAGCWSSSSSCHLPRAALAAPGRRHPAAGDARVRRPARARPTTTSTPGPARGSGARQKLLWQSVVALVVAYQIQNTYQITGIRVPFVGDVAIDPVVYIFFAAFAIVAASNGVNITDGLDGLAGGTLAFAFVVVPDHRAAQRAGPAADRPAVRADHRGAAGLPVVQRPPGPGVHGRLRDRCRSARRWPSSP